ncbi:MAG: hypothetical protein P9M12_07320 [Candidatus Aceula lacicola]|nr:hypothetical protein [Candidatus Aceula lacicola]
MIDLITRREKQLLYKDELGDVFLLLKYGEVFRYSKNVLRVIISLHSKAVQLRKSAVILNEDSTDDRLYIFDVNQRYLPQIIALGVFKRRPHKNGKWIKKMQKKLAHRIIPFNPILKKKGKLEVSERRNRNE